MSMTTTTTTTYNSILKHSLPKLTNPKQHQLIIPSNNRTNDPSPNLTRRCAIGIACAVISLELIGSISNQNTAMAIGDSKWSEKRACPAWQLNSLETVVPENLPRPSTKRRWEKVGFESMRIRVLIRNGGGVNDGCFTM